MGTLNAVALELRPFTIVRTRAVLHIESDQTAASELVKGAYGMIVVSDQAVAAGSASVPGPVSAPDAPFFTYEPFINSFILGTGVGFEEPGGTYITIDSKGMRKVGIGEDVAFIVETAVAFGSLVSIQGRFLIKMH